MKAHVYLHCDLAVLLDHDWYVFPYIQRKFFAYRKHSGIHLVAWIQRNAYIPRDTRSKKKVSDANVQNASSVLNIGVLASAVCP